MSSALTAQKASLESSQHKTVSDEPEPAKMLDKKSEEEEVEENYSEDEVYSNVSDKKSTVDPTSKVGTSIAPVTVQEKKNEPVIGSSIIGNKSVLASKPAFAKPFMMNKKKK